MSTPVQRSMDRNRLIRLIHVAKRELALDDDIYRAMLERRTGKHSTAQMTVPQLKMVLDMLKQHGFKVRVKKSPRITRTLDPSAQARKVRSLWLLLHQLGAVTDPSERALARYVYRITRIDALQWLSEKQMVMVIESLKQFALRHLRTQVDCLLKQADDALAADERLAEIVQFARNRRTFDSTKFAWETLRNIIARIKNEPAEHNGVS